MYIKYIKKMFRRQIFCKNKMHLILKNNFCFQSLNSLYSNPSVYAVAVAAQKPRKSKIALYKSQYRRKNCQKNFYYTDILYYKMSLYKFIQTRSKKCVIENRVKGGITVYRKVNNSLFRDKNVFPSSLVSQLNGRVFGCKSSVPGLKLLI